MLLLNTVKFLWRYVYSHLESPKALCVLCPAQAEENRVFLTNQLLTQMEISGRHIEFQYLIRKLLVSPAFSQKQSVFQVRYITFF